MYTYYIAEMTTKKLADIFKARAATTKVLVLPEHDKIFLSEYDDYISKLLTVIFDAYIQRQVTLGATLEECTLSLLPVDDSTNEYQVRLQQLSNGINEDQVRTSKYFLELQDLYKDNGLELRLQNNIMSLTFL